MNPGLFHKILIIFCMSCFTIGPAIAQVNTESLRKEYSDEGWSGNVNFGFTFQGGNSDIIDLSSGLRIDYYSESYHAFSVANYARNEENDQLLTNQAFIHLRLIKPLSEKISLETFTQKEFNDFIRLKDRNLIGAGGRFQVKNIEDQLNLYLGTGLMFENEKYKGVTEDDKNLIRSTNYVSAKWFPKENISVVSITYFQFALSDFADFRLLNDSTFAVDLIENLLLTIQFTYRFDDDPIAGIKKYDVSLKNGITYNFGN